MQQLQRGLFVSMEGPDGCGKSTNIPVAAEALRSIGYDVVVTREPGGTENAERIRDLILHSNMDGVTELLLFLAARRDHVQTKIIPALEAGKIVLSDRFYDSTFAYQGHGRGLLKELEKLGAYVNGGLEPDHTFFFNLTFEESIKRLTLRSDKQDRLDKEEEDFRKRMYYGYQVQLDETHAFFMDTGRKIHQINAMLPLEQVSKQVRQTILDNFPGIDKF